MTSDFTQTDLLQDCWILPICYFYNWVSYFEVGVYDVHPSRSFWLYSYQPWRNRCMFWYTSTLMSRLLTVIIVLMRDLSVVAIYTGVAKTFSANVGQILLPSKYAFDLGAKLYRTRWVTINCCRYHTNEDFRSAMFIYCSHWCFIHCHLLITAKLTISCGRITLFSPRVNTPCFCPKVINAGGLSQGGARHKTRWGTIPNLILREWHQHLVDKL